MDQKITESHLPGQYLDIALLPGQYLDIALVAGQYILYCPADLPTQSVTCISYIPVRVSYLSYYPSTRVITKITHECIGI